MECGLSKEHGATIPLNSAAGGLSCHYCRATATHPATTCTHNHNAFSDVHINNSPVPISLAGSLGVLRPSRDLTRLARLQLLRGVLDTDHSTPAALAEASRYTPQLQPHTPSFPHTSPLERRRCPNNHSFHDIVCVILSLTESRPFYPGLWMWCFQCLQGRSLSV